MFLPREKPCFEAAFKTLSTFSPALTRLCAALLAIASALQKNRYVLTAGVNRFSKFALSASDNFPSPFDSWRWPAKTMILVSSMT